MAAPPTPIFSVMLFAIAALLGAVGQYLYKEGVAHGSSSWLQYLRNWRILLGVVCYAGVMGLFLAAFRRGGALTVLYPVYASTFIWAALLAWLAYGTPVRLVHVVGMGLMVAGMYFLGKNG